MRRASVLALVVCAASTVGAEPRPRDEEEAARLYADGKRHFDIAEYGAAIAAWKQAYLISSEPLLLFNIGQAYRLGGDCGQANRFYANYQRVEPRPTNRRELDLALGKCAGVPAAVGDPTPPPPDPPPPAPSPPTPSPPPPTVTKAAPTHTGRNLRRIGIAVAATGGITGLAAVGLAVRARGHASDIGDRPNGTTWDAALVDTERAGRTDARRAQVLGAIAIGAVVTGVVLWWQGGARTAVHIAVAPDRAGVGVSCRF